MDLHNPSAPAVPSVESRLPTARRETIRLTEGLVSVLRAGSGDPPLILVHGWGADAAKWLPTIPRIAERHSLAAVDLPGFGESPRPTFPLTMPYYAGVLAGLADALSWKRPVLIGSSMGGQAVLEAGIRFPDRFAGIVAAAPSSILGWPVARPLRPLYRWITDRLTNLYFRVGHGVRSPEELVCERVIRSGVRMCFHRWNDAATTFETLTLRMFGRAAAAERSAALRSSLRGILDGHPGWRALRSTKIPVRMVWGDRDRVVPLRHGRRLADGIPGASLVTIPETGHLPMVESPDRFLAAVLPWIRSLRDGFGPAPISSPPSP